MPAASSAAGDLRRAQRVLSRMWLWAMLLVAVAVQGIVWGAPKSHGTGGAPLPHLRHFFGVGYALILLGAELAFCVAYRLPMAAVWVLVAGACVDLAFWGAHLGGLAFPTGDSAALTAGAGAVVLAAGVLAGRFRAGRPSRSPRSYEGGA